MVICWNIRKHLAKKGCIWKHQDNFTYIIIYFLANFASLFLFLLMTQGYKVFMVVKMMLLFLLPFLLLLVLLPLLLFVFLLHPFCWSKENQHPNLFCCHFHKLKEDHHTSIKSRIKWIWHGTWEFLEWFVWGVANIQWQIACHAISSSAQKYQCQQNNWPDLQPSSKLSYYH